MLLPLCAKPIRPILPSATLHGEGRHCKSSITIVYLSHYLIITLYYLKNMAYMTQEGLDTLIAQLRHLETVERPAASAAIAEARDKGDLSENAEYDAAKEAQGMLELKISQLKAAIAEARIIDTSRLDTSSVQILATVEMKNVKTGAVMKYTIVSESEADLKRGRISSSTPIAQGLLGKKVGDVAEIKVPQGTVSLEVLSINYD